MSSKTKTPAAPKAKKPKSAAALARKAKNEQDYAARVILLKAEQEKFNALRAEHGPLSDDQCRDLLREQAARKDLDLLLSCDMPVGGEPLSKRLVRFLGRDTLKGVALGTVAVREVIDSVWRYAATQDASIKPVDD